MKKQYNIHYKTYIGKRQRNYNNTYIISDFFHCWANVDPVLGQRVANMIFIVKYFRADHPQQNSCECNIKVVHE
jgi:hypothetical protein